MYKVYKKVNELNSKVQLQTYPIIVKDNIFPTNQDKSEAFVNFFSQNSSVSSLPQEIRNFRENEEDLFETPTLENDHYLNADLNYDEFLEALKSFSSNKSAVGIDGMSYQMLVHLPAKIKALCFALFQKIWKKWYSSISVEEVYNSASASLRSQLMCGE